MFHSSLSNLHNKKSRENSFVCERNVQNFPIHVIRALYIDVSLYLTLTIQASSRLKRSANHLWNNSDVCRKKFGEWSLLISEKILKILANRDEMRKSYSGPSIYASCKMLLYLVKWFQRRRFFEIDKSETRIAYSGHVCYQIRTKWAILIKDLP